MKRQFFAFIIRWVLNSLGLWIAVRIFGTGYIGVQPDMSIAVFLLAGPIFSVVPILVTLGLFTVVVNGFMVYISLILAPGLKMTFLHSILTGLIMSLVNYIVSSALELNYGRTQEEQHES